MIAISLRIFPTPYCSERFSEFWKVGSLKNPQTMGNAMNDNEKTYTSLGFQVSLILNSLRNRVALLKLAEEQQEDRERQTARNGADEDCPEDDRHDVSQRLDKKPPTEVGGVWGDLERTARTK
jgi:hypothetical protein